jgi:hypothetical protein
MQVFAHQPYVNNKNTPDSCKISGHPKRPFAERIFGVIHLLSVAIFEDAFKKCCKTEKLYYCWVLEKINKESSRSPVYFLRNEQPSVSLALPPVGWQRTVAQPAQITTV